MHWHRLLCCCAQIYKDLGGLRSGALATFASPATVKVCCSPTQPCNIRRWAPILLLETRAIFPSDSLALQSIFRQGVGMLREATKK